MSIILKTGFVSITHNITFQPQTMSKGKLLVTAGLVRDVEELKIKQGETSIIQARIIRQTSITLSPYNVFKAGVVTSVKCDCVYNQSGKCKHIAALLHYINNEESMAFQKHVKNNSGVSQVQGNFPKGDVFDEMFPTKLETTYDPMSIDLSDLVERSASRSVIEANLKLRIHL